MSCHQRQHMTLPTPPTYHTHHTTTHTTTPHQHHTNTTTLHALSLLVFGLTAFVSLFVFLLFRSGHTLYWRNSVTLLIFSRNIHLLTHLLSHTSQHHQQ